jgi:hypothetical protein
MTWCLLCDGLGERLGGEGELSGSAPLSISAMDSRVAFVTPRRGRWIIWVDVSRDIGSDVPYAPYNVYFCTILPLLAYPTFDLLHVNIYILFLYFSGCLQ